MYDFTTDNVLNAIYAPNDRLGVELMGAAKWNALKKAVAAKTVDKLNKVYGGNRSRFSGAVVEAARKMRATSDPVSMAAKSKRFMKNPLLNDPLCGELWGVNDDYAAELLGYSWGDFGRQVKNLTHKVLEAGENIPIASAAVSEARKYGDFVQTALGLKKSGEEVVNTVYDNRGKIILIGGLGALGLYLLLRKKKR
ncbi:MAG: hypothetical protein VZR95_03070 [Alphaproteobacteria bacterium]